MTAAEILLLGVQESTSLLQASDTGGFYVIQAGQAGVDARKVIHPQELLSAMTALQGAGDPNVGNLILTGIAGASPLAMAMDGIRNDKELWTSDEHGSIWELFFLASPDQWVLTRDDVDVEFVFSSADSPAGLSWGGFTIGQSIPAATHIGQIYRDTKNSLWYYALAIGEGTSSWGLAEGPIGPPGPTGPIGPPGPIIRGVIETSGTTINCTRAVHQNIYVRLTATADVTINLPVYSVTNPWTVGDSISFRIASGDVLPIILNPAVGVQIHGSYKTASLVADDSFSLMYVGADNWDYI